MIMYSAKFSVSHLDASFNIHIVDVITGVILLPDNRHP